MKTVVIVGAGPAGLTAAYELLKNNKNHAYRVIVLEQSGSFGGISRTVDFENNKIDIGGHRFFSKNERVNAVWREIMHAQGTKIDPELEPAQFSEYSGDGDPNREDDVLLLRRRISRIYFQGKLFDYPLQLNYATLRKLGFLTSMTCGFGYVKSRLVKQKGESLEDFYIDRFGRPLYEMFFKDYTTKVWGVTPAELDASWGAQRVKGLSIMKIIAESIGKTLKLKKKEQETSLIEQFYYPKFGPGQLYELMAERIVRMGGEILLYSECQKIGVCDSMVTDIQVYLKNEDRTETISCDYLFSSVPISQLADMLPDIPSQIRQTAAALPYRDFVTIGVLAKKLSLKNTTSISTKNDIPPDCWLYIQDRGVKLGRIQIFNNWSPFLLEDEDSVWIGTEYFCNENDEFWQKSDGDLCELAAAELQKIGVLNKSDVIKSCVIRQKKAYPAYFGSYKQFDSIKTFLLKYQNLFCIGRNGQHRYNNMDHSMLTGMIAADSVLREKGNSEVWDVNTEQEYHESSDGKDG